MTRSIAAKNNRTLLFCCTTPCPLLLHQASLSCSCCKIGPAVRTPAGLCYCCHPGESRTDTSWIRLWIDCSRLPSVHWLAWRHSRFLAAVDNLQCRRRWLWKWSRAIGCRHRVHSLDGRCGVAGEVASICDADFHSSDEFVPNGFMRLHSSTRIPPQTSGNEVKECLIVTFQRLA